MGEMGPIGRPPHQIGPSAHVQSVSIAVLHSPIMTNQAFSSDIRRYAVVGAQARLAEIAQEVEAIRRAFPELRENGSSGARTRHQQ